MCHAKPLSASAQRRGADRQTGKVGLLFPGRVFVHELCLRSTVLDVRRFVHFLCGAEASIVWRKNDDLIQETGMRSGRQTRRYFRNLSEFNRARRGLTRLSCNMRSAVDKEVLRKNYS